MSAAISAGLRFTMWHLPLARAVCMVWVCERGSTKRFCGLAPSPVMAKEVTISCSCSLIGAAIVSHVGSASSS